MKNMKQSYLAAKSKHWSPSTLKPVQSRLALIEESFLPNDPQGLYDSLLTAGRYGAYTLKQVMLLATQVAKHAGAGAAYAEFMSDRRRLFANAYSPKKVERTFEQTLEGIKTMPEGSRQFAIGLIVSGLRISEAAKLTADGQVVGKGNKLRSVPNAELVTAAPARSLSTFRRELRDATGLTPHELRKLAATKLVSLGAREAELCAMFGWSSFQTASVYIQASNVASMASELKRAVSS